MRKKISTLQDYLDCDQGQLLQYIRTLNESEQERLIDELESIDIKSLYQVYTDYADEKDAKPTAGLQPIKRIFSIKDASSTTIAEYERIGLKLISEGKVCIAMMAGGQGTRLGFDKAKGMYDIGLPCHKSLFQIFCERIYSLQNMISKQLGKCLPIYFFIMTSDTNHEETTEYFGQNNFFGLQQDQIVFFQQDSLPILSIQGKLLLSSSNKLLQGPDGNGGIFTSLYSQGYLDLMKCLGIEYIQICPVDNVLCKLADPIWVGQVAKEKLEVGAKFVRKTKPTEKVGIYAQINGKPYAREYSEMTNEDINKRDDKGNLVFSTGGVAQMICTVNFVQQILTDTTIRKQFMANYHIAHKKYDYFDINTSKMVATQVPNALKFELLFFDCFPLCPMEKFALIEAKREDEFGPVKNAPGNAVDSPDTARQLHMQRDRRWLKQLNLQVTQDIEISPKITYFGEGLQKYQQQIQQKIQNNPLIILHESELKSKASSMVPSDQYQASQTQQGFSPQIKSAKSTQQQYFPQTQSPIQYTKVQQSSQYHSVAPLTLNTQQSKPLTSIATSAFQAQSLQPMNITNNGQFFRTQARNRCSPRQSSVFTSIVDQRRTYHQHHSPPGRMTNYMVRAPSPIVARPTVFVSPRSYQPQQQQYLSQPFQQHSRGQLVPHFNMIQSVGVLPSAMRGSTSHAAYGRRY